MTSLAVPRIVEDCEAEAGRTFDVVSGGVSVLRVRAIVEVRMRLSEIDGDPSVPETYRERVPFTERVGEAEGRDSEGDGDKADAAGVKDAS